jgi:anti-sigma28 factor (negative regulator of flagellin synthesis)
MKIDDFFDKTLATDLNMARKSKPNGKPKPEATQAAADKLPQKVKSGNGPNLVDRYESKQKPSGSAIRNETSPSDDTVPVREDRVERAKQLVASGAYNNQDVIDKIIDRLLETIREA